MNLQQMATFVRLQADTDVDDAPDALLEVYARAAYRDIQARVFPWPDKKVTYTFPTVVGTEAYALSALTGGTDLEFVVTVSSGDDVLMYVSPDRFLQLSLEGSGTGTPSVYSVVGGDIKLWPTPAAVETYSVVGFRDFVEWPAGSDEPDLPRGFDEAICWYMLSRFYQSQEDLELASRYMADFDNSVNQQIEKALRTSAQSAGPMIFGGDPRLTTPMSYSDWVKRSVEGI